MKERPPFFLEIHPLLELYQELDSKIEKFKKEIGLDCIKGCGECCSIPADRIEVSVIEWIPLSLRLWETGEAELYLKKMERMDPQGPCVFYKKNPSKEEEACCSIYPWRPLICRVFGFSAMENKYGQPIPVLCSVLRKVRPEIINEVDSRIQRGLEIPIHSHYAKRVALIYPEHGKKQYPINEALKRAIEWVGFYLELTQHERKGLETMESYDRAA